MKNKNNIPNIPPSPPSKGGTGTTRIPVITVDGPSGSGKGTIGYLLARELGWHFLDSGALYRVLALAAIEKGVSLEDEKKLEALAINLNVLFSDTIILEGIEVTHRIREEDCSQAASQVAVFPLVRTALLERQRAFCQPPGLVADGRDMGTVVFKEAILKFFLDASTEERAKRRFLQLKNKGLNVNLQTLLQEIEMRDARDKQRAVAPLKPAEDAWVIDTTGLGVEAVFDHVLTKVKEHLYLF